MAHKFKVVTRPAKNKDGSDSKRKKLYDVINRSRRGSVMIAEGLTSPKEVDRHIEEEREALTWLHSRKHPNDLAFRHKRGL